MTDAKNEGARGASRSDAELESMAFAAGFSDGREGLWWGGIETLARFAELVAAKERVAGELRCATTPVLLDGHHAYTALKVQEMMMAAISMRSNAKYPTNGG